MLVSQQVVAKTWPKIQTAGNEATTGSDGRESTPHSLDSKASSASIGLLFNGGTDLSASPPNKRTIGYLVTEARLRPDPNPLVKQAPVSGPLCFATRIQMTIHS